MVAKRGRGLAQWGQLFGPLVGLSGAKIVLVGLIDLAIQDRTFGLSGQERMFDLRVQQRVMTLGSKNYKRVK